MGMCKKKKGKRKDESIKGREKYGRNSKVRNRIKNYREDREGRKEREKEGMRENMRDKSKN